MTAATARFQTRDGFRQRHPCFTRARFFTGQPASSRGIPDIAWHGMRLNEPLWGNNEAQVLAFTIAGYNDRRGFAHYSKYIRTGH